MSDVLRIHGIVGCYAESHINHPITLWAAETRANYQWVWEHYQACAQEKKRRFPENPINKAWDDHSEFLHEGAVDVPEGPLTPFCDCTNVDAPDLNVFERYTVCLHRKWSEQTAAGRPPRFYRNPVKYGNLQNIY